MDLIRKYQFASLFINQFFPRPGTIAAKMPRLPPDEVNNTLFSFIETLLAACMSKNTLTGSTLSI